MKKIKPYRYDFPLSRSESKRTRGEIDLQGNPCTYWQNQGECCRCTFKVLGKNRKGKWVMELYNVCPACDNYGTHINIGHKYQHHNQHQHTWHPSEFKFYKSVPKPVPQNFGKGRAV